MKTGYKIAYTAIMLVFTLALMFVAVFAATDTRTNTTFTVKFTPKEDVQATVTGGVYVGESSLSFTRGGSDSSLTITATNGETNQEFTAINIDGSTTEAQSISINSIQLAGKYTKAVVLLNIYNSRSSSASKSDLYIVPSFTSALSPAIKYYDGSSFQSYSANYAINVTSQKSTTIMFEYNLTTNSSYSGEAINVALSLDAPASSSGTHVVS